MPNTLQTIMVPPPCATIAAAVLLFLCGCTTVERVRPSDANWAWLCETGRSNDTGLVLAFSKQTVLGVGRTKLDEQIPLENGSIYTSSIEADTTGFIEVFKWGIEQGANAAQTAWSGMRSSGQFMMRWK